MWKIDNMAVLAILVILAGTDIRKQKLSVRLLTVLTLTALAYRAIYREYVIWQYVCGTVPGAMLLGISYITRQALGYGDSWMILILGLYLGISDVIVILMASFFLAAAFSMVWLAGEYIVRDHLIQKHGIQRHKRKHEFAFIPMLALSYLGVILL